MFIRRLVLKSRRCTGALPTLERPRSRSYESGAVAPPDSPACCPRFRRQQASLRKRHGQLSRESEIFVICVYLFWSGFLRGQRTILDMPPALPTMSRSQCAPITEKILSGIVLRKFWVKNRESRL
jgi:hypothetical protein